MGRNWRRQQASHIPPLSLLCMCPSMSSRLSCDDERVRTLTIVIVVASIGSFSVCLLGLIKRSSLLELKLDGFLMSWSTWLHHKAWSSSWTSGAMQCSGRCSPPALNFPFLLRTVGMHYHTMWTSYYSYLLRSNYSFPCLIHSFTCTRYSNYYMY